MTSEPSNTPSRLPNQPGNKEVHNSGPLTIDQIKLKCGFDQTIHAVSCIRLPRFTKLLTIPIDSFSDSWKLSFDEPVPRGLVRRWNRGLTYESAGNVLYLLYDPKFYYGRNTPKAQVVVNPARPLTYPELAALLSPVEKLFRLTLAPTRVEVAVDFLPATPSLLKMLAMNVSVLSSKTWVIGPDFKSRSLPEAMSRLSTGCTVYWRPGQSSSLIKLYWKAPDKPVRLEITLRRAGLRRREVERLSDLGSVDWLDIFQRRANVCVYPLRSMIDEGLRHIHRNNLVQQI